MQIFGWGATLPGCFMALTVGTVGSKGCQLKFADDSLVGGSAGSLLFTAIAYSQREKIGMVECFGDTIHTYAFGFAPQQSVITVSGIGFLVTGAHTAAIGPASGGGGQYSGFITSINKSYAANRISAKPDKRAEIQIGSSVLYGFLVGMEVGPAESWNLVQTTFYLQSVKAQGM